MSEEQLNHRQQLVKEKSMTMEYFLESRNLDKATEELLLKYDRDGNGSFSKDEVVSIIIDLKQERFDTDRLAASNKLYKRLLVSAAVLCVLLLAGMFALSYAVAALTAKTDVSSDGTMVAISSGLAVATDSRADVHSVSLNEEGKYCVTHDEIEIMRAEVVSGKNVVLLQTDSDNQERATQVSGSGTYDVEDAVCFVTATGNMCWVPDDQCVDEHTEGRRLSHEEYVSLGGRPHRRLGHCSSCPSPMTIGIFYCPDEITECTSNEDCSAATGGKKCTLYNGRR